jgi:hypothetical protein
VLDHLVLGPVSEDALTFYAREADAIFGASPGKAESMVAKNTATIRKTLINIDFKNLGSLSDNDTETDLN